MPAFTMELPGISIRLLGADEDCWRVEVCCGNGSFMATFTLYTHPDELEPFAQALLTFPSHIHDEARLEDGPADEGGYHFLLRAFLHQGPGHSVIEYSAEGHSREPFPASATFFLFTEAASINRLGRKLLTWIRYPDTPLAWTYGPASGEAPIP